MSYTLRRFIRSMRAAGFVPGTVGWLGMWNHWRTSGMAFAAFARRYAGLPIRAGRQTCAA